jgi:hypothetical protein
MRGNFPAATDFIISTDTGKISRQIGNQHRNQGGNPVRIVGEQDNLCMSFFPFFYKKPQETNCPLPARRELQLLKGGPIYRLQWIPFQ